MSKTLSHNHIMVLDHYMIMPAVILLLAAGPSHPNHAAAAKGIKVLDLYSFSVFVLLAGLARVTRLRFL